MNNFKQAISRRNFLKNIARLAVGIAAFRLKDIFIIKTSKSNAPTPKEAKHYTRADNLAG